MVLRGLAHICILPFFFVVKDAPERIAWSSNRALQWSDFKGSPTANEGWAASTSSGMSQSYEINAKGYLNKDKTKVVAHFYPEYSWVRAREKTKHLLGHEQVHFDITELHARKLQRLIDGFTFTVNSKVEVRHLYEEIEKERIEMQSLFDTETKHSTDHSKEIYWELQVARWLDDNTD